MHNFKRWFFAIGSFVFLYWYMPSAVSDNRVYLFEGLLIALNVLGILVNLSNIFSDIFTIKEKKNMNK